VRTPDWFGSSDGFRPLPWCCTDELGRNARQDVGANWTTVEHPCGDPPDFNGSAWTPPTDRPIDDSEKHRADLMEINSFKSIKWSSIVSIHYDISQVNHAPINWKQSDYVASLWFVASLRSIQQLTPLAIGSEMNEKRRRMSGERPVWVQHFSCQNPNYQNLRRRPQRLQFLSKVGLGFCSLYQPQYPRR